MILKTFQVLLMPISFGLLFSLMLVYWGQAAFFSYTKYKKLTTTLFFLCLTALTSLLLCRFLDSGHFPLSNLYESLLVLSWSFLTIQLLLQISNMPRDSWRPSMKRLLNKYRPVKDKDSSNSVLSQNQSTGIENAKTAVLTRQISQDQSISTVAELDRNRTIHFIGGLTSSMGFLTYSFAFLKLPKEMQKSTALVPALQSNWLMMHVTVMILSYAALLCGSVLSMVFLFLQFLEKRNLESQNTKTERGRRIKNLSIQPVYDTHTAHKKSDHIQSHGSESESLLLNTAPISYKMHQDFENAFSNTENATPLWEVSEKNQPSSLSLSERLDNYSYRIIALGFPLLTIGIVSGAVWANQAWGSYWSWDPKESWALITWLVFAIYLHARITKGWSGERAAMIATFGFFVVWFCYLGVNLLGTGLHSYGWFSN